MQPVFAALFSKAMQRYEKMNKYTKEIVDFYSSSSRVQKGTGERLATKEGIHTFPRYTCMMPSASAMRLAS